MDGIVSLSFAAHIHVCTGLYVDSTNKQSLAYNQEEMTHLNANNRLSRGACEEHFGMVVAQTR